MWLEMPVEESDERGRVRRTTRNQDDHRGTPQGAPISPLLANLYMRRFVLGWKQAAERDGLRAAIVNYADDFVICCRTGAAEAMDRMRSMMTRLNLTVNEQKTRLCRLPEKTFDFLGYTFGRHYSPRTGAAYIGPKPSPKKVSRLCQEIGELTSRRWTWLSVEEQVQRLNTEQLLPAGHALASVPPDRLPRANAVAKLALRQDRAAGHRHEGLLEPDALRPAGPDPARRPQATRLPQGKGGVMHRVREPDAGNPPVRFDERGVEPEHGRTSEAPATERVGNSYVLPNPPRHTSTLPIELPFPIGNHSRCEI
jgi:hypothetical protein